MQQEGSGRAGYGQVRNAARWKVQPGAGYGQELGRAQRVELQQAGRQRRQEEERCICWSLANWGAGGGHL